ncbi:MAG: acetylxylan esterase [Lachnospiraceae bacterium]|nr:acetylxylan esterase [Lachnospiraceae bacterium]
MSYVSEKEAILKTSVYPQTKKQDFEDFWQRAVAELRSSPLSITRERLKTPYDRTFLTDRLTYTTHDETQVVAFFSWPVSAKGKVPCVVWFHGGNSRKAIHPEVMATGAACLAIDVRSQCGETIDRACYRSGDLNGGLMTCGILDPENHYLRNIYLDAVRAVDCAAELREVDPERIVTFGGSQGGALSIAASALSGKSRKCYTFVTSYCCLSRRAELGSGIFKSVHDYLELYPANTDQALDTLTYFDIINLVSLLKVPASFALGLLDGICLPEFVYSAYTHAACEKDISLHPFTPHTTPEAYKERVLFEIAAL